jgi:RimJ/RimL family protein N-acetyltransferase
MSTYYFEGKVVRLRAVEAFDAETFALWDLDSEGTRRSHFIPFPRSSEGSRRWAEQMATQAPTNDIFRWVIENRAGEMVGTIGSHSTEPRIGAFSYGLAVAREHQRKGYASDAVILVLRYFFEELRYQKCTVDIYSFNKPSILLHERLGFQHEGRIRRVVYTNGQHFDDVVMGITVEEFEAKYPGALTLE